MPYLSFAPPSLAISHDWQKRFTRVEANGTTAHLIVAAAVVSTVYFIAKNWHRAAALKPLIKREPRVKEGAGTRSEGRLVAPAPSRKLAQQK